MNEKLNYPTGKVRIDGTLCEIVGIREDLFPGVPAFECQMLSPSTGKPTGEIGYCNSELVKWIVRENP
jgi:hypothetical protein